MKSIIMSAPMVRALLDGHKTVTRRVMKPQPSEHWTPEGYGDIHKLDPNGGFILRRGEPITIGWGPVSDDGLEGYCSPFEPGDDVYVREAIKFTHHSVGQFGENAHSEYVADGTPTPADRWPWKRDTLPSIHMPQGLARIHLRVTSVRAERLQDITDDEIRAEGFGDDHEDYLDEAYTINLPPGTKILSLREYFAVRWDNLHHDKPDRHWESNPWVWRIEFEVLS